MLENKKSIIQKSVQLEERDEHGQVIAELNPITIANNVKFSDEETIEDKWLNGSLKGDKGEKGEKGDKGDAFALKKIYDSVELMNADFSNPDIKEGEMVAINSNSPIEEDKGKIFAKGTSKFEYVTKFADLQTIKGDKGDKGEKGDKGDRGEKGLTGEKGEKGDPFAIAKTYENKSAMDSDFNNPSIRKGSLVMISNEEDGDHGKIYVKGETSYEYVVNLKDAQGIKGDKGDKGEQGEQGLKGDTGEKGEKGDKGDRGEKGEKGDKGESGDSIKVGTDFESAIESKIFFKVIS